jgi:hypothetical protein
MVDREDTRRRYLDIWNGDASVDELDGLVTTTFRGHMGSGERDLGQLKVDILAYRQRAEDVRFEVVHRFSDGDHIASRIIARATDPATGTALSATGLNISRWEDGLLAEEWAVWEPLSPT